MSALGLPVILNGSRISKLLWVQPDECDSVLAVWENGARGDAPGPFITLLLLYIDTSG
ncbi:hypothetical protein BDN72DRAFT_851702 [Pluteus cervinus]|uniref:Uncharacterized protein n=1 Tax=Pluteus cervinus TaxID=181527 RepID=A0ACD2ZYK4_9AGAR|nr:hypothetical protein BDN72DRAFT_851702 [Pluteus cervinus]